MQKHLQEHFDLSGHTNFILDARVTSLKKQIPGTLLKEKIIGYIPFKLKHLWIFIWRCFLRLKKFSLCLWTRIYLEFGQNVYEHSVVGHDFCLNSS